MLPRQARLQEFFKRIAAAPSAASYEEALQQLSEILNAVEDELTDIPFNPDNWQSDGRLYPPQPDSVRHVPGRPDLTRLRTREHNVFLSEGGALEIRTVAENVLVFAKAGSNGKEVSL